MNNNIILNSDSYKYSQWNQYPSGTEYVYSYIESRGGDWDRSVFFGLQAFLREYLKHPIYMADIIEAEQLLKLHGLPFYREGWEYILTKHHGYLPIEICAVDEGSVIPNSNILLSIVNTDPNCWWLTSFLETSLLRAIWYPTTVATNSYMSKQTILKFLKKNGDPGLIDFKLHDFGARGVSSLESAGLGAMAHLVNFMGTDTITGIQYAMKYYDTDICGFSIPAMEHSTITSWGRENEVDAYRNMVKQHGRPGNIIACVSDSYDIFNACKLWGTDLKQNVIDSGATIVIRPDSGDPVSVNVECAKILDEGFGHTINEKGYRVINNVRLIQGDGISGDMIEHILTALDEAGYSADNIAFGQGGGLLQHVNRDTLKFAMKCSAIRVNGEWRDVYKDPITDPGKTSKKGRLSLIKENGEYKTVSNKFNAKSELKLLYTNGGLVNSTTFSEVRNRANCS